MFPLRTSLKRNWCPHICLVLAHNNLGAGGGGRSLVFLAALGDLSLCRATLGGEELFPVVQLGGIIGAAVVVQL